MAVKSQKPEVGSQNRANLPQAETVAWIDVRHAVPDPEVTVLLFVPNADEPVWLGYRDEDGSGTRWLWVDGSEISDPVMHWAHVPAGPG